VSRTADRPQTGRSNVAAGRGYRRHMRLVQADDERLFHTVTVAARLGRSGKLTQRLLADYDEYWDDPEAAFRYALALVAMIQASGSDQEKRANYTQSMEALDDVVEIDPGHWLARYCRARHRVLIRTGYGRYLADERGKALDDLQELLQRQEQVPWQPYFTVAYLLAAQFHAGQGDQAQATRLISEAGERPRERVPYPALGSIMSDAGRVLYHGAVPPSLKAVVGTTMARLFPGQSPIRSTVRAGATA
jgi:tetratricopeptide (TPR) repeat protein